MPRQNRVTPFGELIATPARGTLMGNRGCLHDSQGTIRRAYQGKRWIICLLDFKNRRRTVMTPGQYTELFFLDEATALAAGHRPPNASGSGLIISGRCGQRRIHSLPARLHLRLARLMLFCTLNGYQQRSGPCCRYVKRHNCPTALLLRQLGKRAPILFYRASCSAGRPLGTKRSVRRSEEQR